MGVAGTSSSFADLGPPFSCPSEPRLGDPWVVMAELFSWNSHCPRVLIRGPSPGNRSPNFCGALGNRPSADQMA